MRQFHFIMLRRVPLLKLLALTVPYKVRDFQPLVLKAAAQCVSGKLPFGTYFTLL